MFIGHPTLPIWWPSPTLIPNGVETNMPESAGRASVNRSAASDRCQVGVKSWVLNCLLEWLRNFVDGRFEGAIDAHGADHQTLKS